MTSSLPDNPTGVRFGLKFLGCCYTVDHEKSQSFGCVLVIFLFQYKTVNMTFFAICVFFPLLLSFLGLILSSPGKKGGKVVSNVFWHFLTTANIVREAQKA